MGILRENTINRMGLQSRKYRDLFQKVLKSFFVRSDPFRIILNGVKFDENYLKIDESEFHPANFNNIHVISAGKCSLRMSRGINKVLKNRINSQLIISADEYENFASMDTYLKGDHPYPGKNSLNSGKKFLEFLSFVGKDDFLISLISGGASSMLILPPKEIPFKDINIVNKLLLKSGATIEELNCVRKHLSLIKGGLAAKKIYPAKVINLIISDTPDGSHSTVGSGLFAWDNTSYNDSLKILEKYDLISKIPLKIIEYLREGDAGRKEETPIYNSDLVMNNSFFTLGDNKSVLEGIKTDLYTEGINTHIISACDSGEVKTKALEFAELIKKTLKGESSFKPPVLLLSGGEYTVNVKGDGLGGRNMEFILLMLKELKNIDREFFIFSFGSDGIDGPTDAAGAWIDKYSYKKSKLELCESIDLYLQKNDSFTFFNKIKQLIKIGKTGTNVMDIRGFFIP